MSQPRLGGTTQVVLESMVSVFAVCAEGLRYLARIRWCRLQSNSPKHTLPSWCVISDTHRIISRRRSTDAAHCQSSRNDLLQAEGPPGASGLCIELGSIARGRDSLWEPCGRPGSVSGAGSGHRSQSRHSGRVCDAKSSTLTNLTSQPDRASVRLNNFFGDEKPRRPVPTINRFLKLDKVPAGRPTANWLPGGGEQAARNAFQG